MPKKLSDFPKDLSEPIGWQGPSLTETKFLNTPSSADANEEDLAKRDDIERRRNEADLHGMREWSRKLAILRKHYGLQDDLPNDDWPMKLCLRLCLDFFPGFNVRFPEDRKRRRRGRKPKWTFGSQLQLIADIERIKSGSDDSEGDACKALLREQGNARPTAGEIHTLQTRLSEARAAAAGQTLAKLRQWETKHEREGELVSILLDHMTRRS
jgi:hypothetical protein